MTIPLEYTQLVSEFCTVVKEDENVDVVYAVLEGYQKILKDVPQVVDTPVQGPAGTMTNGMMIASVVKTVITEKVRSDKIWYSKTIMIRIRRPTQENFLNPQCVCQKLKIRDDSDEDDDEDEELNEEEEIEDNYSATDLIIAAEEIIPLLGETLAHEAFVSYFSNYQRHLLKLLVRPENNFYF